MFHTNNLLPLFDFGSHGVPYHHQIIPFVEEDIKLAFNYMTFFSTPPIGWQLFMKCRGPNSYLIGNSFSLYLVEQNYLIGNSFSLCLVEFCLIFMMMIYWSWFT